MQWRIALCLNTSLDAYIHVPWAEWKAIWSQKKQNVNVFMKLLGQIYVTEHYETNGKVHLSHHRLLSSCPVWTLHRHVLLQNFQLRIYILSVPTLTVPSAQLRCNLLLPLSSSHQLIPSIHPLGKAQALIPAQFCTFAANLPSLAFPCTHGQSQNRVIPSNMT